MTQLRKMMLEELERRNHAQTTINCDIQTVEDFARYFRRPPDQSAFEVGYESASQFNREYSRFFGQSPMRDMRNLRAVGSISTNVA
jgi:AraC-like DNA-binding protein